MLPLSKAVIAVVGLFYAVGYWNAFFNALLYLNDNNKWPMQLVLRTYIVQAQQLPSRSRRLAASPGMNLAPAPTPGDQDGDRRDRGPPGPARLPVHPAHFTKGVIIGAVKG